MNITTLKKPAERADWLAVRRHYICPSDFGVALGLSPFRTPYQLYLEKTGRQIEDREPTEGMLFGIYAEKYCADRYSEMTGRTVRNFGYMLIDEEHHICGDVDRLVVPEGASIAAWRGDVRTDRVLECKTTRIPWIEGEIPAFYQAQGLGYLYLADAAVIDFSVLFFNPRVEWRPFSIERDEGRVQDTADWAKEWFERHVIGDTPPPAICEADCRAMWAQSRGVEVKATPANMADITELRALDEQITALEKREEEARTRIFSAMGEADTLVDPETGKKLATWKSNKDSSRTDWNAVCSDIAGMGLPSEIRTKINVSIEEHTITRPGARTFRLAKAG